MAGLMNFFERMNVWMWILGIFIAHALLYILLGTDNWLATTLLATSVYAVALLVLKVVARRFTQNKQRT
ncbi:hypothetical protein [Brevibacillus dissolubilis]|uniref:hypothetical protein n=1 Tax=Brevibacillus dissolubilis TaxID=1844116 RepID=UPI001116C3DE|nr:hypothetical protein [Brevibacillus dissolubilis]